MPWITRWPRRASKRDTRGNEGIYQLIIMQQARRIDVLEHEWRR